MVSQKKPSPLIAYGPARRRCPVCGETAYSAAGIHPQCAQVRSEATRLARVTKREGVAPPRKTADGHPAQRWARTCPSCGVQLHVRKRQCDCGQLFGPVAT